MPTPPESPSTEDNYDGEENYLPELPQLAIPNPAEPKGYPQGLALELVISDLPPEEILQAYGLSTEEFIRISKLPYFKAEFNGIKQLAAEEGFSYKMKARAQAEGMLKTTWEMVQDSGTPANVRADLIKFMARVAGYDMKERKDGEGTTPEKISITINLGENDVKTITGTPTKVAIETDGKQA